LAIIAARLKENERMPFLHSQKAKKVKLQPHIERIINKTPLITSCILAEEGVIPGKIMGQLLYQAERIAINHDIHSKEMVLNLLKQTENWPK